MKFVIASLFWRLRTQFCIFAFAGLCTLFLAGRTVQGDPLELQVALVAQMGTPCNLYTLQGSNFDFEGYTDYCEGNHLAVRGESFNPNVLLAPGAPDSFPTFLERGDIDVPENPGRLAFVSGGFILIYGPSVTIPLDATGTFQLKSPIAVKGTLSACLTPADEPLRHSAIPTISISRTST